MATGSRIDVDYTSIRHENVWMMSNQRWSEGLGYLDWCLHDAVTQEPYSIYGWSRSQRMRKKRNFWTFSYYFRFKPCSVINRKQAQFWRGRDHCTRNIAINWYREVSVLTLANDIDFWSLYICCRFFFHDITDAQPSVLINVPLNTEIRHRCVNIQPD